MNLKQFLLGTRPKTLVAAVVPVLCAYSLALYRYEQVSSLYAVLCLLLALCIQIATNFYNDAVDHPKGADNVRVGPRRVSTQEKVHYKKVFLIGHLFIALAIVLGIPLVLKGGIVFVVLGLISLYFAYGYTGGPFPLAYLGLGELFVFIFFGVIATLGSYYLMSGTLDYEAGILATQIGLLSTTLIAVNNYRDRKTDVLVHKKTLATKLTSYQYLKLFDVFLFGPYLFILFGMLFFDLKYFFLLFSISLAYKIRRGLRENTDESELNTFLNLSGKHLILFATLYVILNLCR